MQWNHVWICFDSEWRKTKKFWARHELWIKTNHKFRLNTIFQCGKVKVWILEGLTVFRICRKCRVIELTALLQYYHKYLNSFVRNVTHDSMQVTRTILQVHASGDALLHLANLLWEATFFMIALQKFCSCQNAHTFSIEVYYKKFLY